MPGIIVPRKTVAEVQRLFEDSTSEITIGLSQGKIRFTLGDVVLTSGLGEIYPEGLVIGNVARVERKDADPFQAAVVKAAVEMDKLERLYVLADTGK